MSKRKATLSIDDRKAVDIILDHAAKAGSSNMTRFNAEVSPARIAAVTKLLDVLGAMPSEDPPKDLVARTMARIDHDATRRRIQHPQITAPLSSHVH
jgi:hypothetical protein